MACEWEINGVKAYPIHGEILLKTRTEEGLKIAVIYPSQIIWGGNLLFKDILEEPEQAEKRDSFIEVISEL